MWTTVLILALALNLEPNRIGMIGLLLVRPHPIRQLLVFLCICFVASSTAGLIVLYFANRGSLLQGGSTGAMVQIGVGTVALIVAAVLASNIPLPGGKDGRGTQSDGSDTAATPGGPTLLEKFTNRAARLAHGSSLWFAALLAIGISLPSVDYIALLLLIATSGKPPEVQVAALFTFLTVANSILLIPIITYLFAKERTIRTLENIRSWVLARSRRDYAILIALVGVLMVSVGLTHL